MAAGTSPIAMALARDVLIVKPSSLGDVIHALPAVHCLKATYPGVRFHWVVNEEWAPLLHGNPDLASVIPFPRKHLRGPRAVAGFLRWCRSVRAAVPGGFDVAVDFQGLLRSVLIARGCGARSLAGLSDAREGARFFHSPRADVAGILHAIDRYLALSAMLGANTADAAFPLPVGAPVGGVDPVILARAVVLHPFSRGQGKSLPLELLEQTVRMLAPRPVVLVGMGGPTRHPWPDNTLNLLHQTSLPQLLWVLRMAGAVVSVDSGPMHLAAAMPVPLLGLHTWSDPRKVGPWKKDAHIWKSGATVAVADLPGQPAAWCADRGAWLPSLPESIAAWVAGATTTGPGRNT